MNYYKCSGTYAVSLGASSAGADATVSSTTGVVSSATTGVATASTTGASATTGPHCLSAIACNTLAKPLTG